MRAWVLHGYVQLQQELNTSACGLSETAAQRSFTLNYMHHMSKKRDDCWNFQLSKNLGEKGKPW